MENQQPMNEQMNQQSSQPQVVTVGDVTKNGKATTGMVLGIISLIAWIIPLFGLPISIIGIVYSVKGLKSASRGKAMAGLILSIIGLVLTLINAVWGAYLGATGKL